MPIIIGNPDECNIISNDISLNNLNDRLNYFSNGKIHIDSGVIDIAGQISRIAIESTGISIGDNFCLFTDYVFFINNNIMQYRGIAMPMSYITLNCDRVRLEYIDENNERVFIAASIVDNTLYIGNEIDLADIRPDIRYDEIVNTNLAEVDNNTNLNNISKDNQNVHNSFIINKLRTAYNTMAELIDFSAINCNNTFLELKEEILGIADDMDLLEEVHGKYEGKYVNVLNLMLNTIVSNNGYIYAFDTNEINILCYVYVYMCEIQSKHKDELDIVELLKILILNLCDGVISLHDEQCVCLTGRATRMINSVEYIIDYVENKDNKNNKRSIEEVRELMVAKSMVLYNSGEPMEKIKQCLEQEYVQNGILSLEEFQNEFNSWGLEELY